MYFSYSDINLVLCFLTHHTLVPTYSLYFDCEIVLTSCEHKLDCKRLKTVLLIPFISFILVYKWFHSLFFFITKVNLDNSDSLDVLHRLFECLAPIVFRPVDILLKTLLQAPTGIVSRSHLNVWKKNQLKTSLHISHGLSPWKKENCMHM